MAATGLVVGMAMASGCTKVRAPEPTAVPDLAQATSQSKCEVRRSADKPLVIEWPAADRAALEARARDSLVAVRYQGCTMEVLNHCDISGSYDYVALNPKHEQVKIREADELYARLPVGAAALEGKLERSGELVIDLSIVGRHQADRHVVSDRELEGRCEGATHVLTGLTVGAFTLRQAAHGEAGAHAKAGPAGAGGSIERSHEMLARDGDPQSCEHPTADELASSQSQPPARCGALLRVEAVPLVRSTVASTSNSTSTSPTAAEPTSRDLKRSHRRAVAWRATAATSGVLAAASVGGIFGGGVLIAQANDHAVWEEPTADDLRKKRIGTGMLIGSSIGVMGFSTLAVVAATASRRARFERLAVTPTLGPTGGGLQLMARF
ncbi:MAG: hypothetical protein AAF799_16990 [Myxococcota bacterium]